MLSNSRSEFALRDPNALSALLSYDWRIRLILTDAEIIGTPGQPGAIDDPSISTSVLRHLQRLKCVVAVHGVRPHGGRMRLWPLDQVLKVQAVLDLRQWTGTKFGACCEALRGPAQEAIEAEISAWERYLDGDKLPKIQTGTSGGEGYNPDLLKDPDDVTRHVAASIHHFVRRNDFSTVRSPAFLL